MNTAGYTVCFTGHRPKSIFQYKPYDESRRKNYQAIVDRIADFVRSMADNGYTHFIKAAHRGLTSWHFGE